ncbi:MAG TPA: ATP-binding protein, partial [Firmicutes bacterium]|nr:ATP-binding protein [Candidatus Fermentithermobacillaceae bacterium]
GLEALKAEYIDVYLDLHSKARLGLTDDRTKAQITQDGRLKNLEALSAILTNTAYMAGIRERLGSLKPCFSLSKEILKASPVCPECSFKPAVEQLEGTAGLILDHIDRDLDKILENWTKQLIEMLEDPTAQSSIELMAGESKKIIAAFLAKRHLPVRVDDKFVKACNMALTGLVRVRVDIDSLRKSMVQDGGPATVSQLKERLEKHLSDLVKGNDPDKVRIVFE